MTVWHTQYDDHIGYDMHIPYDGLNMPLPWSLGTRSSSEARAEEERRRRTEHIVLSVESVLLTNSEPVEPDMVTAEEDYEPFEVEVVSLSASPETSEETLLEVFASLVGDNLLDEDITVFSEMVLEPSPSAEESQILMEEDGHDRDHQE